MRLILVLITTLFSLSALAQSLGPVDLCTKYEGMRPYMLCHYTDTPFSQDAYNKGETITTLRGTVCLTQDRDIEDLLLRTVEKVEESYINHKGRKISNERYYADDVNFPDMVNINSLWIEMGDFAPCFSNLDEKSVRLYINLKKMNGTINTQHYKGGRCLNTPYRNETHPLTCEFINQFPGKVR